MYIDYVDNYRSNKPIKDQCKEYLFYHAILTFDDGSVKDGIIESIEGNNITILIGENIIDEKNLDFSRQPPRGPNRYRRFAPRTYPINRVAGVGLLPYPIPPVYPVPPVYPYPYPYYPF